MDRGAFKALYLDEATSGLRQMEQALLSYEAGSPSGGGLLDVVFRNVHTLKSSSRAMGYEAIAATAARIETLLEEVRSGSRIFDQSVIDGLLQSIDLLRGAIGDLQTGETHRDLAALLKEGAFHTQSGTPISYETPILSKETRLTALQMEHMSGLSEELLFLRMKIESLGSALFAIEKQEHPVMRDRTLLRGEYESTSRRLHQLTTELHQMLLESRMTELKRVFDVLPRAVRDLSTKLGKRVELRVEGGELRADRSVLERLGGPLLHLVRNSIDHGIIESGSLLVKAEAKGDMLAISVEDDGRGIPYHDIVRVAKARGIIPPDHELSEKEIPEVLFHPHLSTTETPTEISGHGMGLYSVREYAHSVGGRAIIDSPVADGKGTRVTLFLPFSLSLVRILIVRSGNLSFGIPISAVLDTTLFDPLHVHISGGKEMLQSTHRAFPLIRLQEALMPELGARSRRAHPMALFIHTPDGDLAVVVDEVLREEDVVVRPLPKLLISVRAFSGAVTLADGRTALLLDPIGLAGIPIPPAQPVLPNLTPYEEDQVKELINIIAGHAGTAVARRLGLQVKLSIPELVKEEDSKENEKWGSTGLGMLVVLEGAFAGHIVLELAESVAQMAAEKIFSRKIDLHHLSQEERLFFEELGRIAMHAVTNVLSRATKSPVMTSGANIRVDARGALRTYFLAGGSIVMEDHVRVRLWIDIEAEGLLPDAQTRLGSITAEFRRADVRALIAALARTGGE